MIGFVLGVERFRTFGIFKYLKKHFIKEEEKDAEPETTDEP